jgi:hypothetical protein
MILIQAPEVEVAEDVAQKNQAAEAERTQQIQCFLRPCDFRSQMQIGKDYYIIRGNFHSSYFSL